MSCGGATTSDRPPHGIIRPSLTVVSGVDCAPIIFLDVFVIYMDWSVNGYSIVSNYD